MLAALLLLTPFAPASAQSTLTSPGIYTRYVSTAGNYTISLVGASGGMNYGTIYGGTGATVSGTFALNTCDQLTIIVGAAGNRSFSNAGSGGGGAGGTAVILNGTRVLLVAGGGGGATTTTNGDGGGGRVSSTPVAAGGTTASGTYNGAGGGGFGYSGASATGSCAPATAGGGGAATLSAISLGGTGVTAGCTAGGDGSGGSGFGGGGGANGYSGGGGGGYAGGNGYISGTGAAKGGDSYIDPLASNPSATAGIAGAGSATYTNGTVTIGTTVSGTRTLYPATTTTTSIQTQAEGSMTTYQNQCTLIAFVSPAGASPVTGNIDATVYVDASVQTYNGAPYVQRHFDINPAINPNTATANITLYFTQADFNAYNAANAAALQLPTGPTDPGNNKNNLRINQFHGTPTGGTAPANYPYIWAGSGPARIVITPTSVVWKSADSRWEVTFPVTGFSGFFASTNVSTPLPLELLNFTATKAGAANRVEWQPATDDAGIRYEVTRSADGTSFRTIATIEGRNHRAYFVDDAAAEPGVSYYRLKAIKGGDISFSRIETIRTELPALSVRIAPQPAGNSISITPTNSSLIGGTAIVRDMQGRMIQRIILQSEQQLDISRWPAGTYSLSLPNGEVLRMVKN